jgi:hypothetical protein
MQQGKQTMNEGLFLQDDGQWVWLEAFVCTDCTKTLPTSEQGLDSQRCQTCWEAYCASEFWKAVEVKAI